MQRKLMDQNLLVLFLKGELMVNCSISKSVCLKSGMMFLLPKNLDASYKALKDTQMLICAVDQDMKLCYRYSLDQLRHSLSLSIISNPALGESKFLCSLPLNPIIKEFVHAINDCLSEGISCLHFQQIKREELFLYINACYSPDELLLFFRSILNKNEDFRDFVFANYKEIHDVRDFAEKANMSVRTFSRHFKDTFNDTVQHWLLTRKAEAILYDIVNTEESFADISEKYEFSTPSYFSNFCKKYFGKTPALLRKNGNMT